MSVSAFNLRSAVLSDAKAIAGVHYRARIRAYENLMEPDLLKSISLPEREADWARQLEQAESLGKAIFVALDGDRILGFAVIGPEPGHEASPDTAELDRIYVEPDSWAKGIGKSLLSLCIVWTHQHGFKRLCLYTFEFNAHARRFYVARGFVLQQSTRQTEPYPLEVRYELDLHDIEICS